MLSSMMNLSQKPQKIDSEILLSLDAKLFESLLSGWRASNPMVTMNVQVRMMKPKPRRFTMYLDS